MKLPVIAAFSLMGAASSFAANIVNGFDVASNYGSWTNGSDAGTAATFGAWALTNGGSASGHYLASSTTLGSPGADINTSGSSFGMYGHSGETATASRDFNGNTLGVGQTLSLDFAVNFRNGNKGFNLRSTGTTSIFNFNVGNPGGGDGYYVNDATTIGSSIANTYDANTAFHLSFTQTMAGSGTWTITRSGGITDSASGTYTGVPQSIFFYEAQTTNGSNNSDNLFINNLTVVPEPSAAILGAIGSLILLRRRK